MSGSSCIADSSSWFLLKTVLPLLAHHASCPELAAGIRDAGAVPSLLLTNLQHLALSWLTRRQTARDQSDLTVCGASARPVYLEALRAAAPNACADLAALCIVFSLSLSSRVLLSTAP